MTLLMYLTFGKQLLTVQRGQRRRVKRGFTGLIHLPVACCSVGGIDFRAVQPLKGFVIWQQVLIATSLRY